MGHSEMISSYSQGEIQDIHENTSTRMGDNSVEIQFIFRVKV